MSHATVNGSPSPQTAPAEPDWLTGTPMDPDAVSPDPVPSVPGFPYAHRGAGLVIVGPTGGGRSTLVSAGAYDAARAGLRVAYFGGEVTQAEFNARAADLAQRRGDTVDDELRTALARVRYLDLSTVLASAWDKPKVWVEQVSKRFDIVILDPLSAIAATLGLDFDKANAEYVQYHEKVVQPLITRGLLVVQLENVGHDLESKGRAKGVSAKQDRADIVCSCHLRVSPEPGLHITATKVRSIRAPFKRTDGWLFDRATLTLTPDEPHEAQAGPFRPTVLMERLSAAIQAQPGLSKRSVRDAVTGKTAAKDHALELLITEGYVEARLDGQATRHHHLKPFRETDRDPVTQPCPTVTRGTVGDDRDPVTPPIQGGARGTVPQAPGTGQTVTPQGKRPSDTTNTDHEPTVVPIDEWRRQYAKQAPAAVQTPPPHPSAVHSTGDGR